MEDALLSHQAFQLWIEAVGYILEGDFQQGIAFYTKSTKRNQTAEAYTFRGWAYQFLGRTDDAIEECKKAIEVDPSFGNPYNDIGAYLIAKGQLDDAVEWLEQAKTAPRYEPRHFPYMNLARVYAAKGMVLKAIHELEEALRIQPDDPTCSQMLARLRATLN